MTAQSPDKELVLEGLLGIPFFDGNRIDVLKNGVEIFPAMLDAIREARESIEFLTFVYWQGDIAVRFAEALADRARAGVAVRVLLDSFGARPMRDTLIETMTEAGVDVRWFRPLETWRVWTIDNRTHRKILIVDGRVGFTGGVGIASEWEGDARDVTEWRDSHFRITGPAVHGLRGAFLGNWAESGGEMRSLADHVPRLERAGEARLQIVRSTASIAWSDVTTLFDLMSEIARKQLRIATAYFVPDDDMVQHLVDAAGRGVTVQIMLPGAHSDQRVSQLAGEAEYRALLEGGVDIRSYEKTMLHTKIVTVDGELACIGSPNANERSMRQDDEVAVVVSHPETVAVLDRHFDEDLAHCQDIDLDAWKDRGIGQRLLETAMQPFRREF
ncbi:MAG: cardiolipin synthase B [Rhodospirillaceae bacterium]|nr:cardiolipin synthase B [Rhodospirillaceae bacterium]